MMKAGVLPLSLLLVAANLPWATSHTWMFSKGIIIQAGTYKSCPEPWRDDTYACIHLRINPLPAIQCLGHCSVYMFVSVPLSCSISIRTNINEQEKLFKHSYIYMWRLSLKDELGCRQVPRFRARTPRHPPCGPASLCLRVNRWSAMRLSFVVSRV